MGTFNLELYGMHIWEIFLYNFFDNSFLIFFSKTSINTVKVEEDLNEISSVM